MGLIHIYATLSAVEHMTAQFMLSTGLRIAVLRVLPHQAGVALALRASESLMRAEERFFFHDHVSWR